MQYYIYCLQNYFKFSGRARRAEFWYFSLFNFLISYLLSYAPLWTISFPSPVPYLSADFSLLSSLYSLLVFIPGLAVMSRRLHDIGRGAGWICILFLPLFGAIILFVFMLLDGAEGTNRFGPNPKGKKHFTGI